MDPGVRWQHLWELPGNNAWLLLGTAAVGLLLLWITAGALLVCLTVYPPRWGRSRKRGYVLRGRRAWALAALLASQVLWSLYRIDALWRITTPVSDFAIIVEVIRVAAVGFLAWAWRPGADPS